VLAEGGRLEQYASPADVLGHPATPFVADFVGADRGIKRLTVLHVDAQDVRPGPAEGLPTVALGATLRQALGVMLAGARSEVAVLDGSTPVGVLTADALFAAARR
jgi:osmoprotectant transport system ATP-binding protein